MLRLEEGLATLPAAGREAGGGGQTLGGGGVEDRQGKPLHAYVYQV